MNCLCNLFDDNSGWIIVIALIILFCCCGGNKNGCGDCGYPVPARPGCGCN